MLKNSLLILFLSSPLMAGKLSQVQPVDPKDVHDISIPINKNFDSIDNELQNVSHKTGTETIRGNKTFINVIHSSAGVQYPDGTLQTTAAIPGSGDMILAATQTVTGAKNFSSYIGVSSGSLTNPSFRVTTDTGTGMYFTNVAGASRMYIVINSTPVFVFERTAGNQIKFGAVEGYDRLTGGESSPEFKYNQGAAGKLYFRSLILNEQADAVDLGIRRVNGTFDSPSAVNYTDTIGTLYWQPYGTDGTYNPPYASPRYGRTAAIISQAMGTLTADSRPGNLILLTTPENDNITYSRDMVASDGSLIVMGGGNKEWDDEDPGTATINPNSPFRAGATTLGQRPNNALIVFSPPTTSTRSAVAIRSFYTRDSGMDLSYSSATDSGDIEMVASNVKSKAISIDRTSLKVSISSQTDVSGLVRVTSGSVVTSGTGLEAYYDLPNDVGTIRSYNATGGVYKDMKIAGLSLSVDTNGTRRLFVSSTGTIKTEGNVLISSGVKLSGDSGTSGQVLTSGGAGTVPTWTTIPGSGDMILAATQTVTGAKTFNSYTVFNGSATLGAFGNTTSTSVYINGPTSVGASLGTLTNAPSVGNPTGYLTVNINGTDRKIPYW